MRRLCVAAWLATRAVLLLSVFKVINLPGPDVTTDVSVIYQQWYGVLSSGSFPQDDVSWQYPPAAALAILSPALITAFGLLSYASAFFLLVCAADAAVLALLLYAARTRGTGTPRATRGRHRLGQRTPATDGPAAAEMAAPPAAGSRTATAGGPESPAGDGRGSGVRDGDGRGAEPSERGHRLTGVWIWIAGVPLLGPTAYARYDLMVTAVAVAALLALARRPRTAGALAAVGAMLKVWPALLLLGTRRGQHTRRSWAVALCVALAVTVGFAAAMPGALAFLTFQRDRGTEVESLGSLVFHLARHFGWDGEVLLNYGSVEFLGPHVGLVSGAALALTVFGFGWLLLWRLRAVEWTASTPADAAFAAVLIFTTTSRVLSPQYLIWLVGLAAVGLTLRASRQLLPAVLVLAATGLTLLEFPIWFEHVVASDPGGVLLLAARNGLLAAATLISCARLWRSTVTEPRLRRTAAHHGTAQTPDRSTAERLLTR